MFCDDCEMAICLQCILSGDHPKHSFSNLVDILKEEKASIERQNDYISGLISQLAKQLSELTALNVRIERTKKTFLDDAQKNRDEEVRMIDEKYKPLLENIERTYNYNMDKLKQEQTHHLDSLKQLKKVQSENDSLLEKNSTEIVDIRARIRSQELIVNLLDIPSTIDLTVYSR
jgi:DNA repair ATPase RecN